MAYTLEIGWKVPNYLVLVEDRNKVIANATETLEEYLKTNRFEMSPERISAISPIHRAIKHGYPASVHTLYYYLELNKRPITTASIEKYGFLHNVLHIPIAKAPVVEIFKKHCGDKIQILNTVIALPDGEELTDYYAINIINRAEVFTWEGSIKGMHYNDYGDPNAASMKMLCFRNDVIEREVICKDSVTNMNKIFINDALAYDLKKARLKAMDLVKETYYYRIVG